MNALLPGVSVRDSEACYTVTNVFFRKVRGDCLLGPGTNADYEEEITFVVPTQTAGRRALGSEPRILRTLHYLPLLTKIYCLPLFTTHLTPLFTPSLSIIHFFDRNLDITIMSQFAVDENTKAVYGAMFDQMNTLHEQGNEKSAAEAEEIAMNLIAHADLPLLYRTHAHMVLGCGNRDDFLWHAQEAVRIVNKGIEWFGESTTSSALLSAAEDVLDHANRDYEQLEKMKAEREAQGWEYVPPSEVEAGEDIEIVKYGGGNSESWESMFG
jgi:hypothetical protein